MKLQAHRTGQFMSQVMGVKAVHVRPLLFTALGSTTTVMGRRLAWHARLLRLITCNHTKKYVNFDDIKLVPYYTFFR